MTLMSQLNLNAEEELILLGFSGMDATELGLLFRSAYEVYLDTTHGERGGLIAITIGKLDIWTIPSMNLSFVARKHFKQGLPLTEIIKELEAKHAAACLSRRAPDPSRNREA